ncbi:sugar-binding transcriptional regulator [Peribacillus frigoritolerans]|jgi:DNA-binding transcriptional regulator LsrR (DeoR family)|uniref:sugar-binding transcriptional regulator n=1 Tax=Peribacillus frigoritolerans TaxID=450367 RepID=UPI0007BFD98A|nr:sugar-binding transcriptional regulator [Peribacillus frigoritolerans]MED4690165.1 sugar-binding transcriptional regulator [Peribacillus frigoritolerans]
MLNWEERRQLVKVANLYYIDGWTQQQIAKKIGVSRPIISKLLQKARDLGIVEVYIKDESAHTVDLEQQLEKKYGLKDAVVISTVGLTPEMIKKAVGQAGAYYLSKYLKKQDVNRLGISWGSTLAELVKEYPFERREVMNIVPLVGGMGTQHVEIHANQLAYELAKKMNCTCSYLYAPAIVETKELKDHLVAMKEISSVLEEGKEVDVALIGIGNPYRGSTMRELNYLQEDDIQNLRKMGTVGDIASRFFDESGDIIKHPLNDKVIGLSLEHLKQIKEVIGVVEGTHKLESVSASLRGNYLDVLIIDEQTASALLEDS